MNKGSMQRQVGHWGLDDNYLLVLALLLLGYAVLGRMFAYVGIAPVYVGEMVFMIGLVVFLRSGCVIATLATLPNIMLVTLLVWTALRTLPYLGEFGVDALRDSVIIAYGGFAFIVTALLLEKPDRLTLVIRFLQVVGTIIIIAAPVLILMRDLWGMEAFSFVKPDMLAVHLGGAAVSMLLGFRRVSIGWLFILLIGIALTSMQSRGGMFCVLIPITFAAMVSGRVREFALAIAFGGALLGFAYTLDLSVPNHGYRDISASQLVDNFGSTLGVSEADPALEGTKRWRVMWWDSILSYTIYGPYFWTGKGFGINLATDDGFDTDAEHTLRSPHNGHMTILARSGFPGLMLWLLTLASWSAVLLTNMARARMRSDHAWFNFFVLIFCYALGFLIQATFDVALEGPMCGIWFWCLFGTGIGASMIYHATARRMVASAGVRIVAPERRGFLIT